MLGLLDGLCDMTRGVHELSKHLQIYSFREYRHSQVRGLANASPRGKNLARVRMPLAEGVTFASIYSQMSLFANIREYSRIFANNRP